MISIVRRQPGVILVNDRDLMDIMREKKIKVTQKKPTAKKTVPIRSKKGQNITPSCGEEGDITKFLIKKSEGTIKDKDLTTNVISEHYSVIPEQYSPNMSGFRGNTLNAEGGNIKKTTFYTVCITVGDKIRRYQRLMSDSGSGCVMGSGLVGTHNVQLVRSVSMKKVSDRWGGDEVRWINREVTALVYPAAERFGEVGSSGKVEVDT